jgi:hypothetical protein
MVDELGDTVACKVCHEACEFMPNVNTLPEPTELFSKHIGSLSKLASDAFDAELALGSRRAALYFD